jgi:hypothetical protein
LREAHAAINTGTYASWSSAWLARYREGARTHAPGAND